MRSQRYMKEKQTGLTVGKSVENSPSLIKKKGRRKREVMSCRSGMCADLNRLTDQLIDQLAV